MGIQKIKLSKQMLCCFLCTTLVFCKNDHNNSWPYSKLYYEWYRASKG